MSMYENNEKGYTHITPQFNRVYHALQFRWVEKNSMHLRNMGIFIPTPKLDCISFLRTV